MGWLRRYTDSNSKAPRFSDFKQEREEKAGEQEKAGVDILDGAAAATSAASEASEASSVRSAAVLSDAEIETKLSESKAITLSCFLNIAACHLKLGDGAMAEKASNDALKLDMANVKALYRRAQAKRLNLDFEGAKADLLTAAKADPQNREVRKELDELKEAMKEQSRRDKAMFGKMFAAP
jgi:tetratricopeptide (TPR) repeat protein